MNPIALAFADGRMFFVGMVLICVAMVLMARFRKAVWRSTLTVVAVAGFMVVAVSATPLPIWAYLVWAVPAIGALVLVQRPSPRKGLAAGCVVAVVVTTIALCAAEAPYHRLPRLTVDKGTTVYVLGDSISAGMGTRERCWPEVLDERAPYHVVNLAQPGATARSAMTQAKGITEPHSLVIVEIGGNDMLGGTDAAAFRSSLDSLIAALCADGHRVLLLELPLHPFSNAYGRAQRDIVSTYGISMLPKRCFTKVLGTKDGTLDGLHLSQTGHNAMADIIAGVLIPE